MNAGTCFNEAPDLGFADLSGADHKAALALELHEHWEKTAHRFFALVPCTVVLMPQFHLAPAPREDRVLRVQRTHRPGRPANQHRCDEQRSAADFRQARHRQDTCAATVRWLREPQSRGSENPLALRSPDSSPELRPGRSN